LDRREGQEITPEMTADLFAQPETCLAVAMFGEEDASLRGRGFVVRKFDVPKSCPAMHRCCTAHILFLASMWRYSLAQWNIHWILTHEK
jgi:hypothetical protein